MSNTHIRNLLSITVSACSIFCIAGVQTIYSYNDGGGFVRAAVVAHGATAISSAPEGKPSESGGDGTTTESEPAFSTPKSGNFSSISRARSRIESLNKEAIDTAVQLTKDFPNNADAIFLLGKAYRNQGNSEKAAESWTRCLEINPQYGQAYNNLGRIALQKGDYEKAVEFWEKAIEINPKLPNVYYSLGSALRCLGRTKEAISKFQKDIEISELPIQSHFMLGEQYQLLKEYEKAGTCYETVIKMSPMYINAYHGLATVCAMLGDKERSRSLMDKFRNLKEKEMEALKKRDSAFNDLFSVRQSSAKTYTEIGEFYFLHKNSRKTEELLHRASSLDPTQPGCRLLLATLYEQNGRPAKALQCYEQLVVISPDNVNCHMNIGILSLQLQRYDNSEKGFRKAIELSPEQSLAYRYLAYLYLSTKQNLPEARKLAEKAVRLDKNGDNYFVFSLACNMTGDRARAIWAIKQAMALQPRNMRYKQMYEQLKRGY